MLFLLAALVGPYFGFYLTALILWAPMRQQTNSPERTITQ